VDLFSGAEKILSMSEGAWLRHASRWSVWSRFFTCVPLLSLAIWSRDWLGWYSVFPILLALFWVWYNPRAFPAPKSTDNWASKGTFGERIFLERRNIDLPHHHVYAANVITIFSILGAIIWVYGLYSLNAWATITGAVGMVLSKAWFVDRMVWIYDELKDSDPRYKAWLKK